MHNNQDGNTQFLFLNNNTNKSNPIKIFQKENQPDSNVTYIIKKEKHFKNIWQLKV